MRRLIASALAGAGVLALSGCVPSDETAFGRVDGRIAVVFCDPMDAVAMTVTVTQGDGEPETLWSVEGELRVGWTGTAVEEPPPGVAVVEWHPERWADADWLTAAARPAGGENVEWVYADVLVDRIPDTGWLHSDGHHSDRHCRD